MPLTAGQKSCVAQFVKFTQVKESVASKQLKAHNWNVEEAVDAMDESQNETAFKSSEARLGEKRRRQATQDVQKALKWLLADKKIRNKLREEHDNEEMFNQYVSTLRPPPRIEAKGVEALPEAACQYLTCADGLRSFLTGLHQNAPQCPDDKKDSMVKYLKFALRRPWIPTLLLASVLRFWGFQDLASLCHPPILVDEGFREPHVAVKARKPNAHLESGQEEMKDRDLLALAIERFRRIGDEVTFSHVLKELFLNPADIEQIALEMAEDKSLTPCEAAIELLQGSEDNDSMDLDDEEAPASTHLERDENSTSKSLVWEVQCAILSFRQGKNLDEFCQALRKLCKNVPVSEEFAVKLAQDADMSPKTAARAIFADAGYDPHHGCPIYRTDGAGKQKVIANAILSFRSTESPVELSKSVCSTCKDLNVDKELLLVHATNTNLTADEAAEHIWTDALDHTDDDYTGWAKKKPTSNQITQGGGKHGRDYGTPSLAQKYKTVLEDPSRQPIYQKSEAKEEHDASHSRHMFSKAQDGQDPVRHETDFKKGGTTSLGLPVTAATKQFDEVEEGVLPPSVWKHPSIPQPPGVENGMTNSLWGINMPVKQAQALAKEFGLFGRKGFEYGAGNRSHNLKMYTRGGESKNDQRKFRSRMLRQLSTSDEHRRSASPSRNDCGSRIRAEILECKSDGADGGLTVMPQASLKQNEDGSEKSPLQADPQVEPPQAAATCLPSSKICAPLRTRLVRPQQMGLLEALAQMTGAVSEEDLLEDLQSWLRNDSGVSDTRREIFLALIDTFLNEIRDGVKKNIIARPQLTKDTQAFTLLRKLKWKQISGRKNGFFDNVLSGCTPAGHEGSSAPPPLNDTAREPAARAEQRDSALASVVLGGSKDYGEVSTTHTNPPTSESPNIRVSQPALAKPTSFGVVPVLSKRAHSESFETANIKRAKLSSAPCGFRDPITSARVSTSADTPLWMPETSKSHISAIDTPTDITRPCPPKALPKPLLSQKPRFIWQGPEEPEQPKRIPYRDIMLPVERRTDLFRSTEGPGTSAALNRLFDQYRGKDDEQDTIGIEGSINYLKDIGVELDEVAVLAILTEISAPTMGEISRKGFIDGWRSIRAHTTEKQKSHASHLRTTLRGSPLFRSTYRHTFQLALTPGQKSLALDAAIEYWRLLFSSDQGLQWRTKTSPWFDWWLEFLETEKPIKGVSKDVWTQMWEFVQKTMAEESMSWWSEDGAWPGVIDDFVAWVKKKRGE